MVQMSINDFFGKSTEDSLIRFIMLFYEKNIGKDILNMKI